MLISLHKQATGDAEPVASEGDRSKGGRRGGPAVRGTDSAAGAASAQAGMSFPSDRAGLIRQARDNDAPDELIDLIESMPESDQSMHGIMAETDTWAGMVDNSPCRDAGLIASAQRIEHDEVAIDRTLATWAGQLDLEEDAATLRAILAVETSADDRLTWLAKADVTPDAAA